MLFCWLEIVFSPFCPPHILQNLTVFPDPQSDYTSLSRVPTMLDVALVRQLSLLMYVYIFSELISTLRVIFHEVHAHVYLYVHGYKSWRERERGGEERKAEGKRKKREKRRGGRRRGRNKNISLLGNLESKLGDSFSLAPRFLSKMQNEVVFWVGTWRKVIKSRNSDGGERKKLSTRDMQKDFWAASLG